MYVDCIQIFIWLAFKEAQIKGQQGQEKLWLGTMRKLLSNDAE